MALQLKIVIYRKKAANKINKIQKKAQIHFQHINDNNNYIVIKVKIE